MNMSKPKTECDSVSIGKTTFSEGHSAGVFESWLSSVTKIEISARNISEILVKIYQTKRRQISDGSVLDAP